jgi:O-antigen ligase
MTQGENKSKILDTILLCIILLLFIISWVNPFRFNPWPTSFGDGAALFAGLFIVLRQVIVLGKKITIDNRNEYLLIFFAGSHLLYTIIFLDNKSIHPYSLTISIAYLVFKLRNNSYKIQEAIGLSLAFYLILNAFAIVAAIADGLGYVNSLSHLIPEYSLGGRWSGLLGQSNISAILVLVAVAYVVTNKNYGKQAKYKHIEFFLFSVLLILSGVSMVMFHSRTSFLCIIFIVFISLFHKFRPAINIKYGAVFLVGLFIGFVAFLYAPAFGVGEVNAIFQGRGLDSSLRLEAYTDFLMAVLEKPFFGYGINGVIVAFMSVEPSVQYGVYFNHTHNILLDTLVQFGLIGSSIIIYLLTRLAVDFSKIRVASASRNIIIVLPIVIHALLEYPLNFPYLLVLFALFIPSVDSGREEGVIASGKVRSAHLVCILLIGLYLAAISKEYLSHEYNYNSALTEEQIFGRPLSYKEPRTKLLWELNDVNEFIRIIPGQPVGNEDAERYHKMLMVIPDRGLIVKYVNNFSKNGDQKYIEFWEQKLCSYYAVCKK